MHKGLHGPSFQILPNIPPKTVFDPLWDNREIKMETPEPTPEIVDVSGPTSSSQEQSAHALGAHQSIDQHIDHAPTMPQHSIFPTFPITPEEMARIDSLNMRKAEQLQVQGQIQSQNQGQAGARRVGRPRKHPAPQSAPQSASQQEVPMLPGSPGPVSVPQQFIIPVRPQVQYSCAFNGTPCTLNHPQFAQFNVQMAQGLPFNQQGPHEPAPKRRRTHDQLENENAMLKAKLAEMKNAEEVMGRNSIDHWNKTIGRLSRAKDEADRNALEQRRLNEQTQIKYIRLQAETADWIKRFEAEKAEAQAEHAREKAEWEKKSNEDARKFEVFFQAQAQESACKVSQLEAEVDQLTHLLETEKESRKKDEEESKKLIRVLLESKECQEKAQESSVKKLQDDHCKLAELQEADRTRTNRKVEELEAGHGVLQTQITALQTILGTVTKQLALLSEKTSTSMQNEPNTEATTNTVTLSPRCTPTSITSLRMTDALVLLQATETTSTVVIMNTFRDVGQQEPPSASQAERNIDSTTPNQNRAQNLEASVPAPVEASSAQTVPQFFGMAIQDRKIAAECLLRELIRKQAVDSDRIKEQERELNARANNVQSLQKIRSRYNQGQGQDQGQTLQQNENPMIPGSPDFEEREPKRRREEASQIKEKILKYEKKLVKLVAKYNDNGNNYEQDRLILDEQVERSVIIEKINGENHKLKETNKKITDQYNENREEDKEGFSKKIIELKEAHHLEIENLRNQLNIVTDQKNAAETSKEVLKNEYSEERKKEDNAAMEIENLHRVSIELHKENIDLLKGKIDKAENLLRAEQEGRANDAKNFDKKIRDFLTEQNSLEAKVAQLQQALEAKKVQLAQEKQAHEAKITEAKLNLLEKERIISRLEQESRKNFIPGKVDVKKEIEDSQNTNSGLNIFGSQQRPKRSIGRPRKEVPNPVMFGPMRARGRPRKPQSENPISVIDEPKRPRGRPRKDQSIQFSMNKMLSQMTEEEDVAKEEEDVAGDQGKIDTAENLLRAEQEGRANDAKKFDEKIRELLAEQNSLEAKVAQLQHESSQNATGTTMGLDVSGSQQLVFGPMRARGRPRKPHSENPISVIDEPKRPRGRPRKDQSIQVLSQKTEEEDVAKEEEDVVGEEEDVVQDQDVAGEE